MKKRKLVQVYLNDGSALYINGKLANNWFTNGEADLLNALGYKKWRLIRGCDRHYHDNDFPAKLRDVVLYKGAEYLRRFPKP